MLFFRRSTSLLRNATSWQWSAKVTQASGSADEQEMSWLLQAMPVSLNTLKLLILFNLDMLVESLPAVTVHIGTDSNRERAVVPVCIDGVVLSLNAVVAVAGFDYIAVVLDVVHDDVLSPSPIAKAIDYFWVHSAIRMLRGHGRSRHLYYLCQILAWVQRDPASPA